MIMPYDERKQAVQEDFGAFHIDMGYSIKDTFYASIGEAEYSSLYTKTDECCIYVAFFLLLIRRRIDCTFLYPALVELVSDVHVPEYQQELGAEYLDFQKDVAYIKTLLNQGSAGQSSIE